MNSVAVAQTLLVAFVTAVRTSVRPAGPSDAAMASVSTDVESDCATDAPTHL